MNLDVDFAGRVQSTNVIRDGDRGFSRGFMTDENRWVQMRNELKFDVYIKPEYMSPPSVRFEKVFLSYRGAYDAIFEVADRYSHGKQHDTGDFEFGQDDIEYENDLREAFVDFIGEYGNNTTTLRLGRQIVQWGENDLWNQINRVNPTDLTFQMFFSPPEDTATPLWMARLNHEVRDIGPFRALGIEFLAIPDIRPMLHAPFTDKNGKFDSTVSPYGFAFRDFDTLSDEVVQGVNAAFGSFLIQPNENTGTTTMALTWEEDVPANNGENMEYGIRLSAEIGEVAASLYYLVHHQDEPAVDVVDSLRLGGEYANWVLNAKLGPDMFPDSGDEVVGPLPGGPHAIFDHPRMRSYGLSFNAYLGGLIDVVITGEGVYHKHQWFTDIQWLGINPGYTPHEVYESMLGFSKSIKQQYWTGSPDPWDVAVQFYWKHIAEWDDNKAFRFLNREDTQAISLNLTNMGYKHGQFKVMFTCIYDTQGTWNVRPSVKWEPNHKWFGEFTVMTFLGNRDDRCMFPSSMVDNGSEISFRLGYRF